MDGNTERKTGAARAALRCTIPVLTGYLFLGAAFGVLLESKGYGVLWALLMCVFIYAGSAQFVAIGLLATGFDPLGAFFVIAMLNARHIFYGISMLERFKRYGRRKYYMILSLTDETFALLISAAPPAGVDEERFYFAVSVLNHVYWIIGGVLGSLLGTALPINTQGIDFVMTALFVCIFLDQWKQKQNRAPALIGLGVSVVCRVVFGPDRFILAGMAVMVVIFGVLRKTMKREVNP